VPRLELKARGGRADEDEQYPWSVVDSRPGGGTLGASRLTCDSDNYRKPKIHRRMCRRHVADHSAIGRARTEQQDYPEMTGILW
jgi:hypothetical protein